MKSVTFDGLDPLPTQKLPKYSAIDFRSAGRPSMLFMRPSHSWRFDSFGNLLGPFSCAHFEGGIALDQGDFTLLFGDYRTERILYFICFL